MISNFARSLDRIGDESFLKGQLQAKRPIALAMCREQMSDASIAKLTGLSLEEVARLKQDAL